MVVSVKVPFCIPDINQQDRDSILESLSSRWLTGGQKAVEFEKRFADYIGVKYAIAVTNGTTALHLAMRALGIREGDEVIVPTFTFVATANAPMFCGARPVFADINERTFNISLESILVKIAKKTKAIIVVHYGGQPVDMKEVLQIAMKHNLFVVEDCAHSLGATYKHWKTGNMGVASCFSFYPTKNLTTFEGGMVTTNDKVLAEQFRLLKNHCMTKEVLDRSKTSDWYYDVTDIGYNYRLDEVRSSLGISQLSLIDFMNQQRAEKARYYTEKLSGVKGIITPYQAENRTNSFYLYSIRVVENEFGISRDELFSRLSKVGIETTVQYTPLHLFTYFKKTFGYKKGDYPIAEKVGEEILCLPIFPQLKREQQDYVVEKIIEARE